MEVSYNGGTPKSSIFGVPPILGNLHIWLIICHDFSTTTLRTFGQKERVVFVERATHGEVIIGLCHGHHENPKRIITAGMKTGNDNIMLRITTGWWFQPL